MRKKLSPVAANTEGRKLKPSEQKVAGSSCINAQCKLRKQKACKGFEGCPGFKSRE